MHCCHTRGEPAANAGRAAPRPRRIATLIQWAVPVTTLALVPKCPACVAAYVLLFSGVGLPLPAAAAIRWMMIALSVAAIIYLVCRTARRALARVPAPSPV